ncbi:MAG: permease [Clostridiales bacterium]|nr:permease [Clostridiales bacterium]
MFTYILYVFAAAGLVLSFLKDRQKTKAALIKALRSFENILPQLLAVLLLIGMALSILDEALISRLLGEESGALGMLIAAVLGSVTLIPGFVAFPLAASLRNAGAGYGQITMFVTTLMMVGVVTLPMETKFFGRKAAVRRNALAFVYAAAASFLIGGIFA